MCRAFIEDGSLQQGDHEGLNWRRQNEKDTIRQKLHHIPALLWRRYIGGFSNQQLDQSRLLVGDRCSVCLVRQLTQANNRSLIDRVNRQHANSRSSRQAIELDAFKSLSKAHHA